MASAAMVASAYAPILIGGCVAFMLSGIVAVQCIIFFKLYPDESNVKIGLVATVWTLDVAQTAFILASFIDYFVVHFGVPSRILVIPWSIALTMLATALQTCLVHLFYAAKIYQSSRRNWFITGPIVLFATLRLLAAAAATGDMLKLKVWAPFQSGFPHFLFTAGLTLSAGTDAIITLCLCYYLRQIRKISTSSVMDRVLNTLTLYTLQNGFITFLTTMSILLFWLFLPHTTIALALHFVIGKLYPNSLLVLLNTRKSLREMHAGDKGVVVQTPRESETHHNHLAAYYALFPHRVPRPQYGNVLTATIPSYADGYSPVIKIPQTERPPPAVRVKVERMVVKTPYSPRIIGHDEDGYSVYSDDSLERQSFDMDAKTKKRKPEARYIFPESLPSDKGSEVGGRSLGNTSLNWRALP